LPLNQIIIMKKPLYNYKINLYSQALRILILSPTESLLFFFLEIIYVKKKGLCT